MHAEGRSWQRIASFQHMSAAVLDAQETLIAELETAVKNGSSEARVKKLREVSTLFLTEAAMLTDEQVGVFDDVLCRLISRIENKALTELGQILAPVENAPVETIRKLAWNEEITVAGPVLATSKRLTTTDLTSIAKVRGQSHLAAISKRETLEAPVTDVLLERGDREVIHILAANAGAKFSEGGYATLVSKAESDEILSEAVGSRKDLPMKLFRELLARATEAVRAKLLALLPPERYEQMMDILSSVSSAVMGATKTGYEDAMKAVKALESAGRLNEATIRDFARAGQMPEVTAGISVLSASKIDVIADILNGVRNDAVLVPCKAAGLGWPAVEAILQNRQPERPPSPQILELAHKDYQRLSPETAQKTLRFLQVRATVK
jgi:uncharacterized protein (DUF2336 family)